MNCGKDFHPPTATFTFKNVHKENTFHQLSPGIVATPRRRQRVKRRLRISNRRRWLLRGRLRVETDFAAIVIRAYSGDVNGLFRRDVNMSERSDAGVCNDA